MDQTPQDWKEYRRFRALALHEQGRSGTEIAEVLGVTIAAVSRWLVAERERGPEALRSKKAPGATPKLARGQFALLPELMKARLHWRDVELPERGGTREARVRRHLPPGAHEPHPQALGVHAPEAGAARLAA